MSLVFAHLTKNKLQYLVPWFEFIYAVIMGCFYSSGRFGVVIAEVFIRWSPESADHTYKRFQCRRLAGRPLRATW